MTYNGNISMESGDKVLFYYRPTGSYEIVEVINRMDYKIEVSGVVNSNHTNMLKQYVERQNMGSHCLMSAEANASVNENDNTEEFSLDDCAFPTAKQSESYNDVSISDTLTSDQRSEVETLIEQYPDVLSSLSGRTVQIQHDIKLLTSESIRPKGYPIPFKTRDVMETEIQEMIDLEVIEPSVSPYSSPAVLFPVRCGSASTSRK